MRIGTSCKAAEFHLDDRYYHSTSSAGRRLATGSKASPACSDSELSEEELALLERSSKVPSVDRVINILQKCRRRKRSAHIKRVLAYIRENQLEFHRALGNFLVPTLVDCGDLHAAQQVFNRLVDRNLHSWNSLILGYVDCGKLQSALNVYQEMQAACVRLSTYTYVALLKACTRLKDLEMGQKLRAEIAKEGWENDLFVSNALIRMLGKCGALREAQELFDKLSCKDVVSWSSMITTYAEHGQYEEVVHYVEQMQQVGVLPNVVTFLSILKACGSTIELNMGKQTHADICKRGLDCDTYLGNTLIDMYSKCGLIGAAQAVFDRLESRDVVSWNVLTAGYVDNGLGKQALIHFEKMQLEGIPPDDVALMYSLKACSVIGAIETAKYLFSEIVRKGVEDDPFVGNALVDMFCKCGALKEGREIFDKLAVRDAVSWSALITGYAIQGPGDEALKCYERMQSEGISPDDVVLACSLKACSNTGATEKGREIHNEITKHGLDADFFVSNVLVNMYSKCGSVLDAQDVFDSLPIHTVTAWSALVKGYGLNHQASTAVQCFDDMRKQGLQLDSIAFTCLLVACNQANLNLKGQEYFYMLREEHEKSLTKYHYACMVDLLARYGCIYQAYRLLDTMQYSPSKEMWKTLLSACKTHGDVELGLRCFDRLTAIDADDATAFVTMAEVLRNADRWHDAVGVENLRKETGTKKKPGHAIIELKEDMHEFLVGDSHRTKASKMVKNLGLRMKNEGYVPGAHA